MSLFKRGGFNAVNEEKERQEKNRENMQKGLWRFFLKEDGEEADIIFVTEEPINFYEHTIKTKRNGKEFYDNIPCCGEGCSYCADGDRPSFKSAWLVVDRRKFEYKDKDGKKKVGKDQFRLFVFGTKVAGQLDRLHTKYGLTNRIYTIVRTGNGTQTSYMFERGKRFSLSDKEIEQLLPEKLRDEYDGDMDSLYTIIEDQIKMLLDNKEDNEDEDIEDEEELEEDDLVDLDEEEEEDLDEDEEVEDEDDAVTSPPQKRKGSKMFKSNKKKSNKVSKVKKNKKKRIENKVRPSIKSIIKKKK